MDKRLYRSRNQVIIGGVCGGIAEYFDIDVTIVRLIWALIALVGGTGVLLYIIAWIVVPENPHQLKNSDFNSSDVNEVKDTENAKVVTGGKRSGEIFGWILIAIGVYLLARTFIPWFYLKLFWPVILIAFGLLFVFKK
ncbi:phage shock protein C, PspC [Thermoanaerobacterium thermosaccharolyticum DSM 571]|uniref:Phage shock protein C, PspC n=1 Tax=Thermoanaerobacterium thermosaccharolyticum (strain ATCC 7956 / DSM 571 / NCIMB 9385 / NCA 3814 / NCTC 13789 / WDCM 00135 / 2032) TaxID=580327 RepID=D9TNL0_THETC|nr:PspC domain-containing protein [Thermoanaerobacterium thermosaccharolyticum]ADL68616.1 phage shock protein C, PspC [Thermoanaerobacterium thermosaccharolyticum DSM 571]